MRRTRLFLKRIMIISTSISLCFLAIVGCSNNDVSDNSSRNDTNMETSESNEVTEKEESNFKDITEGKLYDAVTQIAEIDYIKEMDDGSKVSIYINIHSDSAEDFIQAAESIVTLSNLRYYDTISVSTDFSEELANIVLLWDEDETRYTSTCSDLTTDKLVEKAYDENEFFSTIDSMNIFNENLDKTLDEWYEENGLTRD